MTMTHLNPDLLRLVLAGELPPKRLLRLLLHHMLDLCPECRAAWEEARAANPALAVMAEGNDEDALGLEREGTETGQAAPPATPASPAADAGPYADAFARAAQALGGQHGQVETEGERAERELATLLELPARERRARVEGAAGRRFRGRRLVQRMLETSLETVRRDAAEALNLAELAAMVLRRTLEPGYVRQEEDGAVALTEAAPDWAHELSLLCLAHAANALRVRGQLPAAELMFDRLRRRRGERGVTDGLVAAELASLEASLRLDQRRFHTAAGLLERASRAYAECGSAEGRATVDLQRAALLRQQGDGAAAAELLATLTPAGADSPLPPSLLRHAVANRALVLCDLDRAADARRLLTARRELFTGGNAWERLRLRWLHGRIALGLEELEEAETALEEARRGFLERGEGFNAALVSLDLAAVHATAGRTAAVRELAAGLEPVFASRDVDRETVATLVLFQRAAAAEEAGRELILRLRQVLERGRTGRQPAARPC